MQRHSSVPHTFEENIAAEKAKLEDQLAKLKPGPQMDAVHRKIRQLGTASHMSEWLRSPGLKPPEQTGCAMRGYYAYIIGDDDRITGRVEVYGEDDTEAKRLAKQLVDGHAVELWQEARMVERFEPEE